MLKKIFHYSIFIFILFFLVQTSLAQRVIPPKSERRIEVEATIAAEMEDNKKEKEEKQKNIITPNINNDFLRKKESAKKWLKDIGKKITNLYELYPEQEKLIDNSNNKFLQFNEKVETSNNEQELDKTLTSYQEEFKSDLTLILKKTTPKQTQRQINSIQKYQKNISSKKSSIVKNISDKIIPYYQKKGKDISVLEKTLNEFIAAYDDLDRNANDSIDLLIELGKEQNAKKIKDILIPFNEKKIAFNNSTKNLSKAIRDLRKK